MKQLLVALFAVMLTITAACADTQADPENTLYLDLKDGRVVIQMLPNLAPKHVARIKELTRQGFYNGITFHRVIEGFMAQAGDPQGTGQGGSGKLIPAEFSNEPFVRGVVGAARQPSDINSADSQFFITFATQSSLNGDYTVWGKVTSGMELVDKLNRCEPQQSFDPASGSVKMKMHCDVPGTSPDKIIKMMVAADEGKTDVPTPMQQPETTMMPQGESK